MAIYHHDAKYDAGKSRRAASVSLRLSTLAAAAFAVVGLCAGAVIVMQLSPTTSDEQHTIHEMKDAPLDLLADMELRRASAAAPITATPLTASQPVLNHPAAAAAFAPARQLRDDVIQRPDISEDDPRLAAVRTPALRPAAQQLLMQQPSEDEPMVQRYSMQQQYNMQPQQQQAIHQPSMHLVTHQVSGMAAPLQGNGHARNPFDFHTPDQPLYQVSVSRILVSRFTASIDSLAMNRSASHAAKEHACTSAALTHKHMPAC